MSKHAPAPILKQVGAKVDEDLRGRLLDLLPQFPGPDGAPASMSSVVRGVAHLGLAVIDTGGERLSALARAWGCSRAEATARVLRAGLDAVGAPKG